MASSPMVPKAPMSDEEFKPKGQPERAARPAAAAIPRLVTLERSSLRTGRVSLEWALRLLAKG